MTLLHARMFALSVSMVVGACKEPEPSHADGSSSTGEATSGGPGSGVVDSTGTSRGSDGSTTGPTLPVPGLELGFSQVKQFDFGWAAFEGAESYELLESAAPAEPFVPIAGGIVGESISITMPLCFRYQASYVLRACNDAGCTESSEVSVADPLAAAVGYFKASNTGEMDHFGDSIALSADGSTLAVGATLESSDATGIDGDQDNDLLSASGAVYVFVRGSGGQWSQQAYIKASNPGEGDQFGTSIALSGDGNTLAVGAHLEDGNTTGIDGNQSSDAATESGAVYVFARDGMGAWSQQAYVKASNNNGADDRFGISVALSGDGSTLAIGAALEDSDATGIDGDQADDSEDDSGAVYVLVRDAMQQWSQQAYVKASNTGENDLFGSDVALSADGSTLAVGASFESSNAVGVGGDEVNDLAPLSGAAYVLVRDAMAQWSQQAYVKASNTGGGDRFGDAIALSGDGNTLAVGAYAEDSNATGIDGDQADDSGIDVGAVYVLRRDAMQQWSSQAYVKPSSTGVAHFGNDVALSHDGGILAVGAIHEDSGAIGIGGDQGDDSALEAGAVYVLVQGELEQWSQQAYVKAPNTGPSDGFGDRVTLNADGSTLAVGVRGEGSGATGIGGDQANDDAPNAGAVYLY